MAEFGPMNRAVGFIAAGLIASGAGSVWTGCGDNLGPPPMTHDELLARLRALQGVRVTEGNSSPEDFSYYVLHFTQPVDHHDPAKGTFEQQVSLLHRNELAPFPLIVYTSGYADEAGDKPVELTTLLDANQISIEHRFYGASRPDPVDWSLLTVDQAADDEHAIIVALRTVYEGSFLSVGESKGGTTALLHRSFYPDDVRGTVAYVTPMSFNVPDPRYPAQLEQVGMPSLSDCHAAVRNLAIEMLNRRARMVDQARAEATVGAHAYTRVKIGPAVEAAIAGLEWGFWQMAGDGHCDPGQLPSVTDGDDALFSFLKSISPVSEYDDEQLGYYAPYYFQSYWQLGVPDYSTSYLTDLWYGDHDYEGELPCAEPAFDPAPMDRLQEWLQDPATDEHDKVTRADLGKHLMFIYGRWDPWFGGRVATGLAGDSPTFIKAKGNHNTKLFTLDPADQAQAFSYIHRWTGVEPLLSRLQRASTSASAREVGRRRPPRLVNARVAPR